MSDKNIVSVTMQDGAKLRVARFEPDISPTGVIQFIHGFGEHIGNYEELAEFFIANGYIFVMHEQRGFGENYKTHKGIVPSYDHLLQDVDEVRDQIEEWYPHLPVILGGHSMGGNIALNFLQKYTQKRYCGAIIESPWLRLYKPQPGFVTLLAKIIGKLTPNAALLSNLDRSLITRRKEKVDAFNHDEIYHDRISFRLYSGIYEAGEYAIKNADKIKLPALLLCAGDDQIVSAAAVREFAKNAGENVKLMEYPSAYHCLHLDAISDQALGDIASFCHEVMP